MSPPRAADHTTSQGAPVPGEVLVLDWCAIADAMWGHARSGVSTNAAGDLDTAYLRRCSRRVGSTTLVFTRDETGPGRSRFECPALRRSWHLSTECRDPVERDAWLRTFFGDHRHRLWVTGPTTAAGRAFDVWHWRLFCDEHWEPAVFDREPAELRAAGYLAASEVALLSLACA